MYNSARKKILKNTAIIAFLSLAYISAFFTYFEGVFTYSASLVVTICIILLLKEKEFYLLTPLFIFFYDQLIIPSGLSVFRIYTSLFFVKIVMQKKITLNKSLIVPLILIILYSLLVIAFYNIRLTFVTIIDTLFIILYISVFLKETNNLNLFFKYYVYAAILSIIYGGLRLSNQLFTSVNINGEWIEISRFMATFGDPNYFGFFINIAIFSILILSNMTRLFRLIFLVILYMALIASVSMTAILCNGLGLLLYFFLMKNSIKKVVLLMVFSISLFFLYQLSRIGNIPIISNAAIRVESMKKGLNNGNLSNLTSNRTTIWAEHLNYFFDQPVFNVLFGGNFLTDLGLDETRFSIVSHHAFINMLLNFGLVGTVIFILFILLKTYSHIVGYFAAKNEQFLLLVLIKFIWLFYAFALSMFPSWMFLLFFLL